MRLPRFLIIGAMKAGTTSLYFDLGTHPDICMSRDKEPNDLVSDEVASDEGRRRYEGQFAHARDHQLCGEASTAYSKLPDVTGVPERALQLLGADLKVVYLVREPVQRTISHHFHDVRAGLMDPDIDRAVLDHPCLIDYSRYAMQLEPWLRIFGREQVHVVRFESFIAERAETVAGMLRWLGVTPETDGVDARRVANAGGTEPASRGPLWRWSRGPFYQQRIRPLLPGSVRTGLRRLLLPKPPPRPRPPRHETVDLILERVRDDVAQLQDIVGVDSPLWDPDEVRQRALRARKDATDHDR